jgi:Tol biopolymer transport system component
LFPFAEIDVIAPGIRFLRQALLVCLLFQAGALPAAYSLGPADVSVFSQNGDLWIKTAGGVKQITDDGEQKDAWAISDDGRRVVYTLRPNENGRHLFSIAIVDASGKQIKRMEASQAGGLADSVNRVEWIDDTRVGVDYHINPSCSQYAIIDTATGAIVANYLGIWFSWSPDKKRLAYVGWQPHFEEQEQPSYFLRINKNTIYPADADQNKGGAHHLFLTQLIWSNDSREVAFVDQVGRHLFLVAASTRGPAVVQKLPFGGSVRDLTWMGKGSIRVQSSKGAWVYDFESKTLKKADS